MVSAVLGLGRASLDLPRFSLRTHIICVTLLIAALVFRVTTRLEIISLGYDLAKARQENVRMDMERRERELQLSVQLRPDRLSQMAKERLAMVDLIPGRVISLPLAGE